MKRIICCVFFLMMIFCCVSVQAEQSGSSGLTIILQTRENTSTPVYPSADSITPVYILPGSSFCALMDEEITPETKMVHIFYINGEKKGATGFVESSLVKQLSETELKDLMNDPEVLNYILDLIDALNEYLNQSPNAISGDGASSEKSTDIRKIYENAMHMLKHFFSSSISSELNTASEKGKEMMKNALGTGKESLGKAREKGKELFKKAGQTIKNELNERLPKAKDQIDEIKTKLENGFEKIKSLPAEETVQVTAEKIADTFESGREQITEMLENFSDKMNSLRENLDENLEQIQQNVETNLVDMDGIFGNKTSETMNNVNSLISRIMETTENVIIRLDDAKSISSRIGQLYRDQGFNSATAALLDLIRNLSSESIPVQ